MKNKKMYVGAGPVSAQKGITLIALIITIIVMLILVAVTITTAINGGLFEKAGKAVGDTKNEINKEQTLGSGSIIDKYVYNISEKVANLPTYSEELLDETTEVLTENTKYISDGQVAVVPKGFKVIPGLNGSTSISDGLVIKDESGNEFVWIPVTFTVAEGSQKDENGLYPEFLEVFYRSAWDNNNRTSTLTTTSFPNSTYTWSNFTEPSTSGYKTPTTESADYYEMMKSVQENKGFYIGRYEAGSQDTAGNPIARTNTANGTSKVVVKRDQYPYIYVGWGLTMSDYTSDVTCNSKNQGKGALYLSKHMYDGKDIGATSTLCYGIQWDAMLEFIKEEKNVTSSRDWGNYYDTAYTITRTTAKFIKRPDQGTTWTQVTATGKEKKTSESILLTTGASDSFSAKNIYDVEGNVSEWTNEAHSKYRTHRGGNWGAYVGCDRPACERSYLYTYGSNNGEFWGFRPVLHIKCN
ncbi:MAG: hypothetical protein J6A29_03400 [Clostridia bacterium]|nr:hypothetical protein [Clostridia bacterium]